MAEPLCNNPNALVTPRGLTFKKPCGLWEAEAGRDSLTRRDRTVQAYRLEGSVGQYG